MSLLAAEVLAAKVNFLVRQLNWHTGTPIHSLRTDTALPCCNRLQHYWPEPDDWISVGL